jgi:hypothetical protein
VNGVGCEWCYFRECGCGCVLVVSLKISIDSLKWSSMDLLTEGGRREDNEGLHWILVNLVNLVNLVISKSCING